MKIYLILLFLTGVLLSSSLSVEAQSFKRQPFDDFKEVGGFSLPSYGWLQRNDDGDVVEQVGFNVLLGYSKKTYFEPVQVDEWNGHWHWGTWALVIPYIGIGTDYISKDGFFFTLGTFYVIPYIGGGFYF